MKIENTKKEVKSYKGILTKYQALPENIQKYIPLIRQYIRIESFDIGYVHSIIYKKINLLPKSFGYYKFHSLTIF